jgi:hypothetical protein
MALLYRGIKIGAIGILLIFCSCKKEGTKEEGQAARKTDMEVAIQKRNLYLSYSKKIMGEKEYYGVYDKAKDSMIDWTKNALYGTFMYRKGIILDSLICFNSKKDKCVMAISYNSPSSYTSDGMNYFYGKKIKGNWYFYIGAFIVLPRDYYQDDIRKPLSLALLNRIAMEEVLGHYLKQKDEVADSPIYEINDMFFEQYDFIRYTEEELLAEVRANWLIKYKPLKEKEIVFDYNKTKKTMKITFPMNYPTFHDIGIVAIYLDYWKTLPTEKETALLGKENGWESYYPQYDRSESVQSGEIKNKNIKNYSKLLVGIEPNASYTMRIEFVYNVTGGQNPIYITHFTAK